MAAESISAYRKPGFPKPETNENGKTTRIEYVGPTATLEPAIPAIGALWGDFEGTVRSHSLIPADGLDSTSELTIIVELITESPEEDGTLESETFEIEWALVGRSMYEHPQFAIGGGAGSALLESDIAQLEMWKITTIAELKALYYFEDPKEPGSYAGVLSDNAKLFARGIELGQETFEDFAPVLRKTSTYTGGPPPESIAGQKDDPAGFPRKPAGYEFRKTADRHVTVGKRTRWERVEEWMGAKKILHDKDEIFWEQPE